MDEMKPVCRVGTARVGYSGRADQFVLNVTVKSGIGLGAVFAPTWDMVMQSKRGDIPWQEYCRRYTDLMRKRYQAKPAAFLDVLSRPEIILCCYCKDTSTTTRHCHRYLLVDILEKVAAHHAIGFEAIGEVRNHQ
jgi:hypothetical protein